MKTRVLVSDQVRQYLAARAPEMRKVLKTALRDLSDWDGHEDPPRLRHLEGGLAGYSRLRVGGHRVIFGEAAGEGERLILCLYAGPRATVYELFAEILLDELAATESPPPEVPPPPSDGH
jgi:mRNA-degrading endonuclease RelE of RelBE toxin-antitoxin system